MAGQGPKMWTVSQVQIDNMLAAAKEQGVALGWRRGFGTAALVFFVGVAVGACLVALHLIG